MSFQTLIRLHLWWRILELLAFLVVQSFGLNIDGVLLLTFKYSVLKDPLGELDSWSFYDATPCSWKGVTCAAPGNGDAYPRVVGLALPNSQLLGSIPADLGMIEHLQRLDLSHNSLNGSLPQSLFNASELQFLDLSNNWISGELPVDVTRLTSLQSLNISDNALAGNIPPNLASLQNLTLVSLKNNYLSGSLPSRFETVRVLDLSSNLLNGSLPSDFGGTSLRYLNISYNRVPGRIPPEFGAKIPGNATIDLSFNNLTGEIPKSQLFLNQEARSYSGNPDLCGEPSKNPCLIPSSPSSSPPNTSDTTSPPAIAAIPRTINSNPATMPPGSASGSPQGRQSGLRPATIVGIVAGDIAGIGVLAFIFLYIYRLKKKKKEQVESTPKKEANAAKVSDEWSSSSSESKGFTRWSCLRKKAEGEESSDTASSDSEGDQNGQDNNQRQQDQQHQDQSKRGTLVTVVGGEKELELETLLKASAYILGATGSSIMYKAVLEDGTALAVRRIGESSVDRFKDFENQVRVVAKLVHPNLVRIRGFYWGVDEKLIIYDFVPNGSLANARYSKLPLSQHSLCMSYARVSRSQLGLANVRIGNFSIAGGVGVTETLHSMHGKSTPGVGSVSPYQ